MGEYLLPQMISAWKNESHIRLQIANTSGVLAALLGFKADIGFIEGARTHPDLHIRHGWTMNWSFSLPLTPLVIDARRSEGCRVPPGSLPEPGSGTRGAADRWLVRYFGSVDVPLELGSNEAVKRAVASGLGLGRLSRYAVEQAVQQGWLVRLQPPLPRMKRTLAAVVHKKKPVGMAAADFLERCLAWTDALAPGSRRAEPRPAPSRRLTTYRYTHLVSPRQRRQTDTRTLKDSRPSASHRPAAGASPEPGRRLPARFRTKR